MRFDLLITGPDGSQLSLQNWDPQPDKDAALAWLRRVTAEVEAAPWVVVRFSSDWNPALTVTEQTIRILTPR
jgi:hypothetical protein